MEETPLSLSLTEFVRNHRIFHKGLNGQRGKNTYRLHLGIHNMFEVRCLISTS